MKWLLLGFLGMAHAQTYSTRLDLFDALLTCIGSCNQVNTQYFGVDVCLDFPDTSGWSDVGLGCLYADINDWDVSEVTNMQQLFKNAAAFNQYIGGWDVSEVTNMAGMFAHAQEFNQDLSAWDVSKVTSMFNMFTHASAFSQNLCGQSWVISNQNPNVYKQSMFFESPGFITQTPCNPGCADPAACNYNVNVDRHIDASCTVADAGFDCNGDCIDVDEDSICDHEDVCVGTVDDCGVCNGGGIAEGDCDCNGNTLDACGVCGGDGSSCAGCNANMDATTYQAAGCCEC